MSNQYQQTVTYGGGGGQDGGPSGAAGGGPPTPCDCGEMHWKSDCPHRLRKKKSRASLKSNGSKMGKKGQTGIWIEFKNCEIM
jgi:hypothetical protein